MNFPAELQYTSDHEWVRIEGNSATVGITEFAQRELGDIVFVDISAVGKDLAAHAVFGSVEAVKTVSDLFLPLAGRITEVNPLLKDQPELVNQDPYGAGWMVRLELADASREGLLSAAEYQATLTV